MKTLVFFVAMLIPGISFALEPPEDPQASFDYDLNSVPYYYNPQTNLYTGWGIAMSEEWYFVGIIGYDKPAFNIFPLVTDAGAVEVFRRDSSTGAWNYFQRLIPGTYVTNNSRFGSSIDVSGDTVVIGAPGYNSGQGIAAIYKFNGSSWSLKTTFQTSSPVNNDQFGVAVAIQGACVAVGAPGRLTYKGSVNVYKFVNDTLTQLAYKTTPTNTTYDYYGYAVDVVDRSWDSPKTCSVAIGAPYADVNGTNSGFVAAFRVKYESTPYTFTDLGVFNGSAGYEYGYSLSMFEYNISQTNLDRIIIGAPGYGISGHPQIGTIDALVKDSNNQWVSDGTRPYFVRLWEMDVVDNQRLGSHVSFNGNYGIVSAPNRNTHGSVYILHRTTCFDRPGPYPHCFSTLYDPNSSPMYPLVMSSPYSQNYEYFGKKVSVPYVTGVTFEYPEDGSEIIGGVSAPYYDGSYYNQGKAYTITGNLWYEEFEINW
ncbi:integrin alpha [Myxococcota bacterium]|nr:integrin alpha [Myxococcota bacterium]